MSQDGKIGDLYDQADFERLLQEATAKSRSSWEEGFIESFRDRYQQYRMNTFASQKQLDILERIAER